MPAYTSDQLLRVQDWIAAQPRLPSCSVCHATQWEATADLGLVPLGTRQPDNTWFVRPMAEIRCATCHQAMLVEVAPLGLP